MKMILTDNTTWKGFKFKMGQFFRFHLTKLLQGTLKKHFQHVFYELLTNINGLSINVQLQTIVVSLLSLLSS